MRTEIKRCPLYGELFAYFDYKDKKYFHNIDNIYYSVFIENDSSNNDSDNLKLMLDILSEYKLQRQNSNSDIPIHGDVLFTPKRHSIYEFNLKLPGKFDVFIGSYIPNDNTPRIVVQLRAESLWLNGEDFTIQESFDFVTFFLGLFGLYIDKIQENRIDYAYHTNAIQKPLKYFEDRALVKHLVTNFKIGSKVFRFETKKLDVNYLSLGQRKSNNLFFRTYNKTREVVEESYKGFFLGLWLQEGLISEYDFYCLNKCYIKRSYDYREKARLEFYIDHGKDVNLISYFKSVLSDKSNTYDDIKNIADNYLPEVTVVMNVEWQTMRKFYYYSNVLDTLEVRRDFDLEIDNKLLRLYKIIDNRKIFLDYLNTNTVKFVNGDKNASWWQRLINTKVSRISDTDFSRIYSRSLDVDRLTSMLKSNLSTLSLYLGNTDSDINGDLSLLLNYLNDNDMNNNDLLINQYGEVVNEIYDPEYLEKKEKKKKSLSGFLSNLNPSVS